MIIARYWKQVA